MPTINEELIRRQLLLERELQVRLCERDLLYWIFNHTRTKDEQDTENSYKPFPRRAYFEFIRQYLDHEPTAFIEKSRTMMLSWFVSAYFAHKCFTTPAYTVIFQSEDEDRAVHDVKNVKCLWEQSLPELRKRWALKKPMEKQPYNKLEMANGSWLLGIPGDPDKIRSEHPTAVVFDEAAFISRGLDNFSTAKATRCKKIVAFSSAETGWFEDVSRSARPVDWPDYSGETKCVA